jgi:hypothetical protein
MVSFLSGLSIFALVMTGVVKDDILLRRILYLNYLSYAATFVSSFVPYWDAPTKWALVCRESTASYLETPYNAWWLIRFLTGFGGAWTSTGSVEKKDKSPFGYFLRHLKYVTFHFLFYWVFGLLFALILNLTYVAPVLLADKVSTSPFWRVVRRAALVSAFPGIIAVLLPMWYFAFGMKAKEDRWSMLPRDESNMPILNPSTIWPSSNLVVLGVQSIHQAVVFLVMVYLTIASLTFPPT